MGTPRSDQDALGWISLCGWNRPYIENYTVDASILDRPDYQKIISNHANVIWITVLRAEDIFEEHYLDPKYKLQRPTQHHIYCECGIITLPTNEAGLNYEVKKLQKETCNHIKVSTQYAVFSYKR